MEEVSAFVVSGSPANGGRKKREAEKEETGRERREKQRKKREAEKGERGREIRERQRKKRRERQRKKRGRERREDMSIPLYVDFYTYMLES